MGVGDKKTDKDVLTPRDVLFESGGRRAISTNSEEGAKIKLVPRGGNGISRVWVV